MHVRRRVDPEGPAGAVPGRERVPEPDAGTCPAERAEPDPDRPVVDFDRVGAADGVTWWASGTPLPAWEPGAGWARDPFVDVIGETVVSPVADTTLTVSAPEDLTVLMTGDQDGPSAPSGGRRTWTSAEPVARDVAVAVGEFTTTERDAGGTRVVAGSLDGDAGAAEPADGTVTAIAGLEEFLGPFPYGS